MNEKYFLNIWINHFNHAEKSRKLNNVNKGNDFDDSDLTKGIDKNLKPRGRCWRKLITLEYGE